MPPIAGPIKTACCVGTIPQTLFFCIVNPGQNCRCLDWTGGGTLAYSTTYNAWVYFDSNDPACPAGSSRVFALKCVVNPDKTTDWVFNLNCKKADGTSCNSETHVSVAGAATCTASGVNLSFALFIPGCCCNNGAPAVTWMLISDVQANANCTGVSTTGGSTGSSSSPGPVAPNQQTGGTPGGVFKPAACQYPIGQTLYFVLSGFDPVNCPCMNYSLGVLTFSPSQGVWTGSAAGLSSCAAGSSQQFVAAVDGPDLRFTISCLDGLGNACNVTAVMGPNRDGTFVCPDPTAGTPFSASTGLFAPGCCCNNGSPGAGTVSVMDSLVPPAPSPVPAPQAASKQVFVPCCQVPVATFLYAYFANDNMLTSRIIPGCGCFKSFDNASGIKYIPLRWDALGQRWYGKLNQLNPACFNTLQEFYLNCGGIGAAGETFFLTMQCTPALPGCAGDCTPAVLRTSVVAIPFQVTGKELTAYVCPNFFTGVGFMAYGRINMNPCCCCNNEKNNPKGVADNNPLPKPPPSAYFLISDQLLNA